MSTFSSALATIAGRQHNRLLRLSFPNGDAPGGELLVDRLDATEGLGIDFRFRVELLSDDAHIAPDALVGKLLCVSLVKADGSLRHFTGYVRQFRFVVTDGGFARYEAMMAPWTARLHLRRNNRLFHQQTVRQQTEALLRDHGALPQWQWKVMSEQRQYTMCTQFDESDHNYLHRRIEAEGWITRFDHTAQGHQWVVYDDSHEAEAVSALPLIRYHDNSGAEEEDAVASWSPVSRWGPGEVTLTAFDFKNPTPQLAQVPAISSVGDLPSVEVHRYAGHYGYRNAADGDRLAILEMSTVEALGAQFEASGNCSRVEPGRWFSLADHYDDQPADGYLVLYVEHQASNNYLQSVDKPAEYRNRFFCQSRSVPWHPGLGFNSRPQRIMVPQSATVVGPEAAGSLHVDEYGRVNVQFHWDRDRTHSCSLRVAGAWAGGENGLVSLPRVGSEVLVQWLDGNPDHPIVTGALHNAHHMPPWKLPAQRVLSGLRTRELVGSAGNQAGGRSNHMVLDDTQGHIQAQLRSDHLGSQSDAEWTL